MQDQGKRLLLAVGLAFLVMLAWSKFFQKAPPPAPAQGSGSAAVANGSGAGTTTNPGTNAAPTPSNAPLVPTAPSDVKLGEEQLITLKYPNVVATFSSYGGVLAKWHLTDERYQSDASLPGKGELLPTQPGTGAFAVNFDRTYTPSTYVLPARSEWSGTKVDDHTVIYKISTPELDVEKTFTLDPEAYLVKMTVKVKVKVDGDKEAHETLQITSFGFQDPKTIDSGSGRVAARVWESSTYRDGSEVSTGYKDLREGARYERNIRWTGFEHPFLLVAFAPKPDPGEPVDKHTRADPTGLMQTDLLYPQKNFDKGSPSISHEVVGYLGPKNVDLLAHVDQVAGFETDFNTTIDLGWFGFIGKPLLWLLQQFFSVVGNWGVAIIMLTITVKAATLYWTTKSMRSMKAMAALGPQMKALNEKYKGDKQRLQVETMALYKQHEVNPVLGCLPMFAQMPIWIALYRTLQAAGELYRRPFISGWIDDLTARDPYYVLPVALVVTMFVQARLQPMNDDPSQKMQQNIMKYGMPIMFGTMSFMFPAGLSLYWMTNTLLTAVHSVYMNKFDKKSLAIAAMIKKNKAAAAAKPVIDVEVKEIAKAGKKSASNGNGKSTTGKNAKPKLVLDVPSEPTEAEAGDDAGDGDDSETLAAPAEAGTTSEQPRSRRRKKRRR